MNILKIVILFIFVNIVSNIIGQKKFALEIKYSSVDKEFTYPKYDNVFTDSLSRSKELQRIITEIQSVGFVELNIDSSLFSKYNLLVFINLGEKYIWKSLEFNTSEWKMLQSLKLESQEFDSRDFNYLELLALQEDIIIRFENSGYPFASIRLDDIIILNKQIEAKLIIDKGPLIIIDTILNIGFNNISSGFIQQYLGVKIGEEYDESKIARISKRIKRLDFLQEKEAFRIDFTDESASIFMNLMEKRNNQFSGIMGFQPNPVTKKLQFTGNLNLKLVNRFGRGERLSLRWESPGNESQFLEVSMMYPYVFNSVFGLGLDFKIDKRDTSFVNLEYKPSVLFALGGQDYISVYGHFFKSNNLISNETVQRTDNQSDVNSQTFGLGLNINHLNDFYNPRSGYSFFINIDAGKKQYVQHIGEQSNTIDEMLIRGNSIIKVFIPLFKRQTIYFANKNAIIQSNSIMINEQYKIGGFKLLRGFDEQSLFASFYNVSTVEYRFLLDEYSYLGAFYDIAQIVNPYSVTQTGVYQSFGISFNFATKAGIFGLSYAIGKYEEGNFEFGQAKIHFGYMAVF